MLVKKYMLLNMCVYLYIDLSDRKREYNQETTQMFKSKQLLQEPSTDWNM